MHAFSAPVSGISLTLQLQAEILSAQSRSRAESDSIRPRVHSGLIKRDLLEPVSADRIMPYLQILRCAIAAAQSVLPPTTYASSSFTRYRNGLSPVSEPDASFPLT
jgi:hypothetical protein